VPQSANDLDRIERIEDVEQLEELLSRPTPEVVESMRRMEGDLIILGVGGKIGPSLARMARRATDAAGVPRRVLGVARFSAPDLPRQLEAQGIEPIRCDLLDRSELARLPEAPNVLYLAAMKFGSTGNEALTWAMNSYLPGMVCERYCRSRIVSYSTGNVYGLVPVNGRGSREEDSLRPDGDYAMSCLGRERIFNHFSQRLNIPCAVLRLNYATEMRYGVLVDVALKVLTGEPIDVTMGYFNAIWQGDSNAMTLRAFEQVGVPAVPINIAGQDKLRVREIAQQFGRLMDRTPTIVGSEAPDALLSDGRRGHELLGRPRVPVDRLIRWIADWHRRGGSILNKPTHFETRDGKF